jgi:hypothetical protein
VRSPLDLQALAGGRRAVRKLCRSGWGIATSRRRSATPTMRHRRTRASRLVALSPSRAPIRDQSERNWKQLRATETALDSGITRGRNPLALVAVQAVAGSNLVAHTSKSTANPVIDGSLPRSGPKLRAQWGPIGAQFVSELRRGRGEGTRDLGLRRPSIQEKTVRPGLQREQTSRLAR